MKYFQIGIYDESDLVDGPLRVSSLKACIQELIAQSELDEQHVTQLLQMICVDHLVPRHATNETAKFSFELFRDEMFENFVTRELNSDQLDAMSIYGDRLEARN